MRTVKIPDLEYTSYKAIMEALIQTIPYALVNQSYAPDLKVGIFTFWDSDYIPESWDEYVIRPPNPNVEKLEMLLLKMDIDEAREEFKNGGGTRYVPQEPKADN